jgi:hypothetical protein
MINELTSDLSAPVYWMRSNSNPPETYVTWFEYNQRGEASWEDKEQVTFYAFQFDVWSSGNYIPVVDELREVLTDAGFTRTFEQETYEDDTDLFRKIMRFHYYKELI